MKHWQLSQLLKDTNTHRENERDAKYKRQQMNHNIDRNTQIMTNNDENKGKQTL